MTSEYHDRTTEKCGIFRVSEADRPKLSDETRRRLGKVRTDAENGVPARRKEEGARGRTTTLPRRRDPWGLRVRAEFLGKTFSQSQRSERPELRPAGRKPRAAQASAQARRGGGRGGASALEVRTGRSRSARMTSVVSAKTVVSMTGAQASNLVSFNSTTGVFSAERPA